MKFSKSIASRDETIGKLLKGSFWTALSLFGILVIFKLVVPSTHGGWSIIPIVDYILIAGFMVCFICMASAYSFQAWTKNEKEYYEWLVSLGLLRSSYSRFMSRVYSKSMYLWSARLIPIIVVLFVCVFVVLIPT